MSERESEEEEKNDFFPSLSLYSERKRKQKFEELIEVDLKEQLMSICLLTEDLKKK